MVYVCRLFLRHTEMQKGGVKQDEITYKLYLPLLFPVAEELKVALLLQPADETRLRDWSFEHSVLEWNMLGENWKEKKSKFKIQYLLVVTTTFWQTHSRVFSQY